MKSSRMSKIVLIAAVLSSTILFSGVLLAEKSSCSAKGGASCTSGDKKCNQAAQKCSVDGQGRVGKCKADAKCQADGKCKMGQGCPAQKCMVEVKAALEQVAVARKAVQAGNKAEALAALSKIEANLQAVQKMPAKKNCEKCKNCGPAKKCMKGPAKPASRPAVVNKTCPIMGSKIDPDKVPANLYREFKGKGVGFCCGGCPAAWDKLSDEEKQAKLDKVAK